MKILKVTPLDFAMESAMEASLPPSELFLRSSCNFAIATQHLMGFYFCRLLCTKPKK